uniref:Uncharacterized protein n=1 Tax=Rhodnius prolixus TaxID=13249 RepID=T1IBX7_RHOPR
MRRYWEKRILKTMETFKASIEKLINDSEEGTSSKEEDSINTNTKQDKIGDQNGGAKDGNEAIDQMEVIKEDDEVIDSHKKRISLSLSDLKDENAENIIKQSTRNLSNQANRTLPTREIIKTNSVSPSEESRCFLLFTLHSYTSYTFVHILNE